MRHKTQHTTPDVQALYIHIPFCHSLCPFCSFAVRKNRTSLHSVYINALLRELECRRNDIGKQVFKITTIFIGGGTPSVLSLKELQTLISGVTDLLHCTKDVEITLEINPEDANLDYVSGLLALGVNRFSVGGQSFQDSILKTLGRRHSSDQLHHALKNMRNAGVQNLNLDLMFAIPGQSMQEFQADLDVVLNYEPEHLSVYGLEIGVTTAFARRYGAQNESQDHQLFEEMYLEAVRFLEKNGWQQYEVSNFARPEKQSKNNLWVWSGGAYLGLGVGAHSYVPPLRWNNIRPIRKYMDTIMKIDSEHNFPIDFEEELTTNQCATESLMLGLRQASGVNIKAWKETYSIQWTQEQEELLKHLCNTGKIIWKNKEDQEWMTLSTQGFLLADAITARLLPS